MFEKIGIVGLLGILMPGAYLAGSVLVAIGIFVVMETEISGSYLIEILGNNTVVFSTSFFMIAYLLGVIMRLIGPNLVDFSSSSYFKYLRKKEECENNLWMFEKFPYKNSLANTFKIAGMEKVITLVESLNEDYAARNNRAFFNYCKLFIEGSDPELFKQVNQAEAMNRFLAGSALALFSSVIIWLIMCLIIFSIFSLYAFLIVITNLALLVLILERFKLQRRREVFIVWCLMYLLVKGGVSKDQKIDPSDIQKKIRMSPLNKHT